MRTSNTEAIKFHELKADQNILIESFYVYSCLHFSFGLLDINECASDALSVNHTHYANDCHDDSNCTNTKGSFYCTCLNGYSGNGVNCVGKPFSRSYSLNRRILNFVNANFSLADVNECEPDGISDAYKYLVHNCHNDSNCTNEKGSFYCTCLVGYSGDGVMCTGKLIVVIFPVKENRRFLVTQYLNLYHVLISYTM